MPCLGIQTCHLPVVQRRFDRRCRSSPRKSGQAPAGEQRHSDQAKQVTPMTHSLESNHAPLTG